MVTRTIDYLQKIIKRVNLTTIQPRFSQHKTTPKWPNQPHLNTHNKKFEKSPTQTSQTRKGETGRLWHTSTTLKRGPDNEHTHNNSARRFSTNIRANINGRRVIIAMKRRLIKRNFRSRCKLFYEVRASDWWRETRFEYIYIFRINLFGFD